MDNSQLPGGGLPPMTGLGPFKVKFEADTVGLTVGVNTALDSIREELFALKSGLGDFESSLAHSLSSTITRMRGDIAAIVADIHNAARDLQSAMPYNNNSSGGWTPLALGHSQTAAGHDGGSGHSPGTSSTPPPVYNTGYSPSSSDYREALRQFDAAKLSMAPGQYWKSSSDWGTLAGIDPALRHQYTAASSSFQQHLTAIQTEGKTPQMTTALNSDVAALQHLSTTFKDTFEKQYGPQTGTGQKLQSLLTTPGALDAVLGQSLRPSDIQAEVLKRSPELANNPGLLQEEILAERQSRQKSSSETNKSVSQAQYLLEGAAAADLASQAAKDALTTAKRGPSPNRTLKRGVGEWLAGEALGNVGNAVGGPYAQLGSMSFYANSWQAASQYDLQAGATGLNAGVNPNTAIGTFHADALKQHLAAPAIAQTAGIESSFAGVRGAAFLFKDSADTYQFATFMGISGSLAGQVAGQAIGGGSTQAPGALFSSIQKAGQLTGLSNTTVANLVSTMQNALSSSYQSTQQAPGYAAGMASFFKNGMGMTPTETTNAVSQYAGMMGNGPHTNLISGQILMQADAAAHGGRIGSIAALMNNATSGLTPAEFQAAIPMLKEYASQGQMQFQLAQQGILGPNLFGANVQKEYQAFKTQSTAQLLHDYTAGLDTQSKTKPTAKPTKPPKGVYEDVLQETATVQNLAITAGNITIRAAKVLTPAGAAGVGVLSHILEMAGGVTIGEGILGGIGKLLKRGGGGSGGSGPLGGGSAGGACSPCEQGISEAVGATASSASKVVNLLEAGALGVGATMLLDKSGKWLPNMLSPTGQAAAAGHAMSSVLTGLNSTLTNLNSTLAKMNGNTSPGGSLSGNYLTGLTSVKGANISPFAKSMSPYAAQVSKATGLPEALLLAQWSLESGNGTSVAAKLDNNLGGMKPWGPYGAGKDSKYAGFSSLQQFAQADAAFYNKNSNYAQLLTQARSGASMGTLLADLQNSGYAGNPNYGSTLAQMLATGAYGSYTPGSISPGASTVPNTPVQIQLGQQLLASLSGQAKAPKTGHPDTPSTNAGLSLAALLAKFMSGQSLSASPGLVFGSGASALSLSALLSGGGIGVLGLLGAL